MMKEIFVKHFYFSISYSIDHVANKPDDATIGPVTGR